MCSECNIFRSGAKAAQEDRVRHQTIRPNRQQNREPAALSIHKSLRAITGPEAHPIPQNALWLPP